jgi:DNA polymerase-3 subunit alpha
MGFPGYFLIVCDFGQLCADPRHSGGAGTRSAAGSIVAYTTGSRTSIPCRTTVFERSLNPGRISMPDIDTDFCVAKRGRIIEYIRERYGSSQVAQIITYSYLKAKAVIKDVARVLDISFERSNEISNLIPRDANALKDAFVKS